VRATVIAAGLLVAGVVPSAAADPLDELGFGSAAAGMAGTRTASATGAEAAHYNAAGVALGDHPSVLAGWSFGHMRLQVNGRDADVLDAHGASLGLAIPISLGAGWKLGAGIALYLPDQFLARVQLIPTSEPHFVLLDNDPHRAVIEPVAAVAYGRRFAVGLGASIFADAESKQIVFDVGVEAGEKVGEAALDITLPVRVAPIIAAWVAPHPRVRLGAMFRGELSLDLTLDILSNVEIAGVVTGDVLVSIRAANYFTPAKAVAGIAVDVLPELTVSADATWQRWSAFGAGVPDLEVLVALDIAPPLVSTTVPPEAFEDTVSVRGGAELRLPGRRTDLALRTGMGWIPSPVPDQVGITSFADGDRLVTTIGAGITLADWAPILTRPIDLDLALGWQHVGHRLTRKDANIHPGEAFSSGGDILQASLSTTVRF
jgi:hypothetical protein